MTEEQQHSIREEVHTAKEAGVWGLALQLVNTIGVVMLLLFAYNTGEWKGGIDIKVQQFDAFMASGDRYPLSRGAATEARLELLEKNHRADMKELRQEILDELRAMRGMIEKRK